MPKQNKISQRKKIYRKTNHSLKLRNMKQLRKSKKKKVSKKFKGGMDCMSCGNNNMKNNNPKTLGLRNNIPFANNIKNKVSN